MPALTLIQLISEQTIPNLLPILAFRPAAVIHLTTERTAPRSSRIASAATKAGCPATLENIRLSPMPSIDETARAVGRAIHAAREAGSAPVLNFTGGTKLMSIGAYEQAKRDQCPSFYVDTHSRRFENGQTGNLAAALPGHDPDFHPLEMALNLDVMVAANGHQHVTRGRDWQPLLPAARYLLSHPDEQKAAHQSIRDRKGDEPRDAAAWLAILDHPIPAHPDLVPLLLATGLFRPGGGDHVFLPDPPREALAQLAAHGQKRSDPRPYFNAVAPLQQSTSFLGGGWWEIIIAEAMAASGRFRDLRWSARVCQQSGQEIEEDLLALDGVEAVCVSCKTGGAKARLLGHLEEFQSRAEAIGGRFTKRWLAIPWLDARSEAVRRRASELGIQVLTATDLNREHPF